jgi:hypothetical protein
MSVFPTKILLATDGSDEAAMAAEAAAELSKQSGSEIHVAYVLPAPAQLIGHHLYSAEMRESLLGGAEREAERFLKDRAEQIGADGGKVAETHLRSGEPDKEILRLGRGARRGAHSNRQPGLGRGKQGADGQRLRIRRPHGPLPRLRGAPLRQLRAALGDPTDPNRYGPGSA